MQQRELKASCRAVVWLVGSFLAVGVVQPVAGADPPAKKAPSKTAAKAKPNLLTRDQLRACMEAQDRVQHGALQLKQDEASLEQTRSEVERIDADIARRLAALDPADTATRQTLTEEENRRNELADTYNARLRALREEADSLTAQRNSWTERCADRNYDELDEIAIKRERQRATGGK